MMITPTEYRALTAKTMSEADLQAKVIAIAKTYGFTVYHAWTSIKSERGYPDLTMVKPGRLIFAELKSESGRTTPAQDRWLDLLRSTGAEVRLWRPRDLLSGEIQAVLR